MERAASLPSDDSAGPHGIIVSNEINPEDAALLVERAGSLGARLDFAPCPTQGALQALLAASPGVAFLLADFLPTFTVPSSLRWIQSMSAGVNQDAQGPVWADPNVSITTASGILSPAMAQYVMASILHAAHHFDLLEPFRDSRDWGMRMDFRASLLLGKTVGLLGYGGVGRDLAGMATAFGMKVMAFRRTSRGDTRERFEVSEYAMSREARERVTVLDAGRLEDVLEASDFLVCALPLTADTRGLIDAAHLARLKPGCILVNVSRGAVIDEAALVDSLRSGRIARAYLDVFDEEPLPNDSPLWSAPNVVLTPHVSGIHDRGSELGSRLFVENLRRFVAGENLLNLVNRAAGY